MNEDKNLSTQNFLITFTSNHINFCKFSLVIKTFIPIIPYIFKFYFDLNIFLQ